MFGFHYLVGFEFLTINQGGALGDLVTAKRKISKTCANAFMRGSELQNGVTVVVYGRR